MFIRIDVIHERDGQTDTAWQQRPRLCIASRGKNGKSGEMTWTLVWRPLHDLLAVCSRECAYARCCHARCVHDQCAQLPSLPYRWPSPIDYRLMALSCMSTQSPAVCLRGMTIIKMYVIVRLASTCEWLCCRAPDQRDVESQTVTSVTDRHHNWQPVHQVHHCDLHRALTRNDGQLTAYETFARQLSPRSPSSTHPQLSVYTSMSL